MVHSLRVLAVALALGSLEVTFVAFFAGLQQIQGGFGDDEKRRPGAWVSKAVFWTFNGFWALKVPTGVGKVVQFPCL